MRRETFEREVRVFCVGRKNGATAFTAYRHAIDVPIRAAAARVWLLNCQIGVPIVRGAQMDVEARRHVLGFGNIHVITQDAFHRLARSQRHAFTPSIKSRRVLLLVVAPSDTRWIAR